MSKSTIKHIKELPDWFKLEKYEVAKTLDEAGWYEQLTVRRLLNWLLSCEGNPEFKDEPDVIAEIKVMLDFLHQTPVADFYANTTFHSYLMHDYLHELKTEKPQYSLGVHLATVRQHVVTTKLINAEKHEFIEKMRSSKKWFDESWLDEPIDNHLEGFCHAANVRVNMYLPDKVLIEQFKTLLNELRKNYLKSGFARESNLRLDFGAWSRFGVLPYLDLTQWANFNNFKIPNRVIADAIFPIGEGGEEVVRKTTQKLAIEAIDVSNLDKIAAVAANNISERNRGN